MRSVWIVAGTLLMTGCHQSLGPEAARTFQQAQQSFDSAKTPTDYLLAASLFQRVLDQGIESGAIYYNQGNAYIRGGQRGRAIACYRQAQRYLPRDTRLAANLHYARGAVSGDSNSPRDIVLFWQNWLSYPEKFQATAVFAVLTLILGIVSVLAPANAWRRTATASLMVTFLLGCSAMYDWYRFERVQYGVVTKSETIARKGNAESYEPALTAALPEGAEFRVVETRGTWYLARFSAGQEGWLKGEEIVIY